MHPPPLSSCKSLPSSQKKTSRPPLSFSGSDSETPLLGSWAWPLVRELSSHMAGGVAKNPKRQQQQPKNPCYPWSSACPSSLHHWFIFSTFMNLPVLEFLQMESYNMWIYMSGFFFFFFTFLLLCLWGSFPLQHLSERQSLSWLISVVHRGHILFIHLSIMVACVVFPLWLLWIMLLRVQVPVFTCGIYLGVELPSPMVNGGLTF